MDPCVTYRNEDGGMRRIAILAVWTPLLLAQGDDPNTRFVTAVRHWSLGEVTRVAVEVSADFTYHSETLHNPERVYFDIPNTHPKMAPPRVMYTETLDDDPRVKRLRVAETTRSVTRVVLDLAGPLNVTTSQLANPDRLIIEVRAGAPPAAPAPTETTASAPIPPLPEAPRPGPVGPFRSAVRPGAPEYMPHSEVARAEPSKNQLGSASSAQGDDLPTGSITEAAKPNPLPHEPIGPVGPSNAARPGAAETSHAARRTSGGDSSLIRELGLKISRVVIDPGHGGHDQGTEGSHGLVEKELVLDVAKRVGRLIEEKLGAEVIYTRSDDTFVPLESRTALANEKKADLFLSIHANSSPLKQISGMETFYLNFADSKDAADLAARENAAAQKSISELTDLIQKITLHEKVEESRELAGRVQSALFALSAKNSPGTRNRGVKKAPFVVLIGAQMPSILAEIGFLSNLHEETLLKKPDYRQKLAEALFQGVKRYADGLSHFQVAQTQSQP
jgi:N-acetylmuramoyl-L-alanine amidase